LAFRYLRDPLFLFCVIIYFVNRWAFKAIWDRGFVHEHLNDLICLPFWVPIMLSGQRCFGLSDSDERPRPRELIIPLIVWSWVFEIILPRTAVMGGWCVADHADILYYAIGALSAGLFWKWWYGDLPPRLPPLQSGARPDAGPVTTPRPALWRGGRRRVG
jgi:hypothetical protein